MDLIDELEANRAMFTALCLACEPADVMRPVPGGLWRVREHVAHVASYDQLVMGHLASGTMAGGAKLDSSFGVPQNGDTWNEAEVKRRESRDITSLLDEMTRLRSRSLEMLTSSSISDAQREVYFPGDARRGAGMVPLRLWLRYWSKHDMLHGQAVVRAVPQLASNADFRSWLADDPLLDALNRETNFDSERGDHGVAN
jgi:hypothetical protein